MGAAIKEIPVKKSFKFRRVEVADGERILEVNGVLPIPVSEVHKYLPVSSHTVKRLIQEGKVTAYNMFFEKLPADDKHQRKFINLNEWGQHER